jgi:Na+/proline symporter
VDATTWQWILLVGISLILFLLAPFAKNTNQFFKAAVAEKSPGGLALAGSLVISWIFAKSITNAANLGLEFGLVGGVAYASYYLSFAVAGWIIYQLRVQGGFGSIHEFLRTRFGRQATGLFSLLIVIRLFNEVWSNTMVIGTYFGNPGDAAYYSSIVLFTFLTLAYAMKGGLSSSIFTDLIQMVLFVVLLLVLLGVIFGSEKAVSPQQVMASGTWTMETGLNLMLAALLQSFSYPFHDPVLTDRGFVNKEKTMLKSFVVAGLLGFVAVFIFSLVGVHARLNGIEAMGNAPAAVGQSLGLAALFFMSVVMMTSAGSTLDSTFTSLAKSLAVDLPRLAQRASDKLPSMRVGAVVMVIFAFLGNLPMFAGTDILKATTISGTMVMGLAPVFLFYGFTKWSPWSFHLSFWTGLGLGVLLAVGLIPASWAIGDGQYAMLLGVNAYGFLICTAGFFTPLLLRRLAGRSLAAGEA